MTVIAHCIIGEFEDWDISSQTSPGKTYLVSIDHEEGTVYCTCPDFQYRKQTEKFGGAKLSDTDNHCKHIKEVLDEKGGNSVCAVAHSDQATTVSDRI